MPSFEEIGRRLDRELERLRHVAESKISPRTRLRAVRALRGAAQRLSRLAEQLESQVSPKSE